VRCDHGQGEDNDHDKRASHRRNGHALDSEIPLWTSATVGGVPFLRWADAGRPPVTAAEGDDLRRQVMQAGYEVLHGKGYTNYAIALATARIIEAVLYDEHQVLRSARY
jgi:L-lactate dehydrogenase